MALMCVSSLSILLCSIEIVKLGDDVGLELFKPGIKFVKQLVKQLVKHSIQLVKQLVNKPGIELVKPGVHIVCSSSYV